MRQIKLNRQRGMSLIEVLISLVIFAFGMLAAAGLQLASLKSSQYSSQAVNATTLAREYGEIMQMIPSATLSSTADGTNSFFIDTAGANTADAAGCTGAAKTCGATAFVAAMVRDWSMRVSQSLPGGRAEVCRDSTPRDNDGNLQWGGCDDTGEMTLVKVGWAGKTQSVTDAQSTGQTWMTDDRPRFVMSILGNLKDYTTE